MARLSNYRSRHFNGTVYINSGLNYFNTEWMLTITVDLLGPDLTVCSNSTEIGLKGFEMRLQKSRCKYD
jgi:hypothetical protein